MQILDSKENTENTNKKAMTTLVTVFFFWGFIAAGNNVFIPFCKTYFKLDQFQSQLIDFAFYTAYFVGALSLFATGIFSKKEWVARWGYKRSIVYGLLFSAVGAITMIIAVYNGSYPGMLGGLFMVALGFSLQQTSANPFANSLGSADTGASRITLGGAINSFGTAIGPLVVAFALFGTTKAVSDEQIANLNLSSVVILYGFVALLFVGAAALFHYSKRIASTPLETSTIKSKNAFVALLCMFIGMIVCFTPVFQSYRTAEAKELVQLNQQLKNLGEENATNKTAMAQIKSKIEPIKKQLDNYRITWLLAALAIVIVIILFSYFKAQNLNSSWGAFQYPQLAFGMLAIFVYVGVEVSIGSNLPELLKRPEFGGFSTKECTVFVSMYWGSLMIGRWAGAITAFNLKNKIHYILTFVVPFFALGVVLLANYLSGNNIQYFKYYFVFVLVQIAGFYLAQKNQNRSLIIFSILGAIFISIGILNQGTWAIYSLLAGGLCCSILWPCIFSLAIKGLGNYTTQGSAFLIMMILGGGIIPPIQGKVADIIGIHNSYWVGVIGFLYLLFYGLKVLNINKKIA